MTVTVDEVVQLRVGGLPVEVAHDLSSPAALQWAQDTLSKRSDLARVREQVSDELAELIARSGTEWRKELVQLRRAVFNGRSTAKGLKALPEELAQEVEEIIRPIAAVAEELKHLETLGREGFSGWLVSERERLSALLDNEDFRDALSVAVPSASGALAAYPRKGAVLAPPKDMRKCERSLMSYAMRAATKTSPFSTFTPTALTTFSHRGKGWDALPSRPVRHTRWSVYPVARTLGWMTEDHQWLSNLPLRLSRTVQDRADGSFDVVRSTYEFKDSHRAEDYATCGQDVVRLRKSEVSRIVSEMLQGGPRPFGDVVDHVVSDSGLSRERAEAALKRLVRLGFVQVDGLDLHPHTAHHAGESRQVLKGVESAAARGVVGSLDRYESAAQTIGSVSGMEREQLLSNVRKEVEYLYELAGLEATPPRTVVYEDCVLGNEVYEGPVLRWTQEECRALSVLVALLDSTQADRALMRGYFVKRFGLAGRCTDVLGFLRSFDDDLYDSHKTRTVPTDTDLSKDPWLRWGDAWRWAKARRVLQETIEAADSELDLMPLLQPESETVSDLDLPVHRYMHLFLFAQLLPEQAPGSMVVNRVFGQAGFGLSRFAYMHGDKGTQVATGQESRALEQGVRLAEVSGGSAFTNLNLHGPLLGTEIVQPGDPGGSRTGDLLALEDLVIEDRPDENRLVLLDSAGVEVQPAYLGYLILSATPGLTQLLCLLSPATNITSSFTPSLPEGEGTRMLPRVRLGSLILRRRTWQVPLSKLPTVDPSVPDGYLEWVSWWRQCGFPEKCYVSAESSEMGAASKPRYLDIAGLVNLATVQHDWRSRDGWLNIAEPLPGLDQTLVNRDNSHRIHEMVLGFDLTDTASKGGQ